MVFCTQCGSQVAGGARFCSSCGTPAGGGGGSGASSPKSVSSPSAGRNSPSSGRSSPSSSGGTQTYVSGGIVRSSPPVKAVSGGYAGGAGASYAQGMDSYNSGLQKSSYKVTYEKQPSWAFAEQHKNSSGQYKTGQFRHVNL